MAYHISASDANKLVLERDSAGCSSSLFAGVGSLFLAIGIGLNIFMDSWEVPYIIFRLLFPLFGGGAIAVGIYLPKQILKTMPAQITFDHTKGLVIVEMVKKGNETGYIRYDEIEGFDIFIEIERSSSSSSSRSVTTTYYSYHVFLKKKDGGEWFLMTFNTPEKADAAMIILRSQVQLDRPTISSFPSTLTPKISLQEGIEKTMIHWQNKVSVWQPIFLLAFSIVFLGVFAAIFQMASGSEMDYFMYGVGGFILLVFCFVMVSVVRKMIKDSFTRYAIAISKTHLEYYEFSKSTGVMKNKKALPVDTVDRIVYSFNPTKPTMNSTLTVMTKEDIIHVQEVKEKPLTTLKDIFTGKDQPLSLSITSLNPVECLQLERWLQDLILKKSERKIL